MILTKKHIENLHRAKLDIYSRRDYLRLDMNENIIGLPREFVKEVLSGIDPEYIATYPEYTTLIDMIAKHNMVAPDNICLSNGSDAAIKYIYDAYVSPGDKVLLTDPTFAMYPVYCDMFNADSIFVSYLADLSFPVEEFLKKLSRDIKLAVIVSPNNPTGTALELSEINAIIERAYSKDVLLIVDEAYFYFHPETIIEKINTFDNLIVLRTFSKICGMATSRLGYAVASAQITEYLRIVKPTYDVNGLSVLIAENLLTRLYIIEELLRNIHEGKEYIVDELSKKGIEFKKGKANFVLIRCPDRVDKVVKGLFNENILVGGRFQQPFLKDFIRVTIGDKKIMQRFCDVFFTL
ncbi:histidinol phosphate aminotransferase [Candidatus Magnetobacterium bavaricum]|uniref:Histidinol phosphate aminotransferase n=1 Tax=Candidatus Magnetobacterium bavaricum TaxID=29290 RepID=A0A0F3GJT6_9BACT|nr:histidinol phosphate aminotransferase [Candidatus Magnetobacterium bavaricum]